MSSILSSNKILKQKAERNSDLRKALYYAYHQKRGYGNDIHELPINNSDQESFLSSEDDSEISTHTHLLYRRIQSDFQAFKKAKKRGVKNGTVLKLVPQSVQPKHRMQPPIKNVWIRKFINPINCKIFQKAVAKGQECFSWSSNVSEYHRLVATTYYKEEECFGVQTEEKNIQKEHAFDLESSEMKYYLK